VKDTFCGGFDASPRIRKILPLTLIANAGLFLLGISHPLTFRTSPHSEVRVGLMSAEASLGKGKK
jgi:hypothetical protein